MEPDALSNQSKSGKSLKERIKSLFLHQNRTLPDGELDKLVEEVSLYQQDLEKKSQELAERVKELNCLYNLSLLIEKPGITPEELMQSLVELVPASWQYPEITCARIIYDEKAFKTANFQETPWKQSASISVNNEKKGALELFLIEEKPEMDEGPFLKEERDLIDTLARNLGRYLERNTMEKALRDSGENLRITLQSLGDAVIATDTNGQIIRMNPVAEELTGWKYSEAENKPIDEVFRIVNAITGMKAEDPVTKVLETGKIVGLANHTKLISKNGQEYQIADSGAPITDGSGETIGVVLVFRDVTEEYRIQEKLKASEELYRTVFENTGTATTILEKDGTISLANKEFAKLSGYSVEEIENKKNWMEFVVPEDLERMKEQHELRRKNSESALKEYEFRFIDKNQNLKHIHLYIDMIRGTDKSVSSLLDITDLKKKGQKLAHSHELMRYIIEHANSGVAVHDNDLKYIYVSQRYLKQYKVKEEDVIGRHHYDVFPDLPQKWRDVHQRVLKGEVLGADRDSYPRDDGTVEWTRWQCLPWYNSAGDIGGLIVYTEVITDQVKAEQELKEKIDEFEKFNRVMVGRENRMIELKQQINELLEKLGQNKKYRIREENEEK